MYIRYIYTYVYILKNIDVLDIYIHIICVAEGDSKVPFSIATTPRRRGGRYSFPLIAPLYLDPYNAEC